MEEIRSSQDYIQSLKNLKRKIIFRGEEIKDVTEHPITRPHILCYAMTYKLEEDERFKEIATVFSPFVNKRVSRFLHIGTTKEDYIAKIKLLRILGQVTGTCFQRCSALDGLNAIFHTTYIIDRNRNTDYNKKFTDYIKYAQNKNLALCIGMTDVKGDRTLSPSQQDDPDVYLRIVKRKKDGIIIRGAKMHITGAICSHEILVAPTTQMKENERDWACICAVPLDSKGIFMLFGRQSNDSRKVEKEDMGNPFGTAGGEALVIFDDVFVPYERVFMNGEAEYTGLFVDTFTTMHRQDYGGCKSGVCDVIVGCSSMLTKIHGVEKGQIIKDKMAEMVNYTETLYGTAIASCSEGKNLESGVFCPNPVLSNTTKLNSTKFIYEVSKIAHDISGGFIGTSPSERDFNTEVGKFLKKYLRGKADTDAALRIRLGRLLEAVTSMSCLVETMHGAGSPQTQKMVILKKSNIEEKEKIAEELMKREG